MNEKKICPYCRSSNVSLIVNSEKIGKAIGGSIGSITGYFSKTSAIGACSIIGAQIGSVIPVAGTSIGAVTGGIIGAVTGLFSGAAFGKGLGKQVNKYVNDKYKCKKCNKTFTEKRRKS